MASVAGLRRTASRTGATRSAVTRRTRGALLAVGLALTVAGQLALVDGRTNRSLAIWLVGLGIIVMIHQRVGPGPPFDVAAGVRPRWSPIRIGVTALAAAASLLVVALLRHRSHTTDFALATAAWILAMVYLVTAAGWGEMPRRTAERAWTAGERWCFAGIIAVSAAVRLVHLGHFPTIVDGDGAAFALLARAVRDGTLRDPFTTGYLDHGTLFAFIQAGVTAIVGDTLAGARTASALAGVGAVAVTYILVRRLHGRAVAALAAAILAMLPLHVFFGREALNNVFDTLAVVALLYFVERAFAMAARRDAALAGIVVGLGMYFYVGGRVLAVLIVPIAIVATWQRHRAGGDLRTSAALAGWIVSGAAVAFLPLGLHYLDEPWDFAARANAVQVSAEWIEAEAARTTSSELAVVQRQATDALFLPFAAFPQGHFRPGTPLLGLPVAIPAAIGIAIATASAHRRRYSALVISWWVSLAAVGMTVGLSGQRWAVGGPLAAIAAAIGIDAVWRTGRALLPVPVAPTLRRVTFAGLALVIGTINGFTYFRERNALSLYGDVNSLIATDVGRRLQDMAPETVLYMVTPPRMGVRSHPTIELLVRGFDGHDVAGPILDEDAVPMSDRPALYVLVPERRAELVPIGRRCPGGEVRDVKLRDGSPLYTSYLVDGCLTQRMNR